MSRELPPPLPNPPAQQSHAAPGDAVLGGAPALAAWHTAWALGCALLALAARFADPALQGPASWGLIVMTAPGLAGLLLLRRDGLKVRLGVLTGWSLAAIAASVMSGGMAGPLAGFVLAPAAAGLALGGLRLGQMGALGSGVAALGGLLAVLIGAPVADSPLIAAGSGILTAGAFALALQLTFMVRGRRLARAEAGAARAENILLAQPGLTLVLSPAGRVLAAYGAPPPGLQVDELFEHGLIAATHAPDRPGVLTALERAMAGMEAQARFAPRMALDRRAGIAVRRLDEGRLIARVLDATGQYAREAALDAARAEAEARDVGKSRFLAAMSHELRTPLNAVVGFADIMRQQLFGPLPERYADYARSIHEAGGHLLAVINDVLDVSKIEADRYELNPERFDAREAVAEAVAMLRLSAEEKALSLNSVTPNAPLWVTADRRALKQMALNLISNAVKFTPEGGAVTVMVETVGPYLELVVSDTGVGIAAEDLKRLGRPFEQAGGADQKARGTGLGLALVRSLAELHGGRLSVDSTLGEGSAFTVRLPVVELRPASAASAPESQQAGS